MGLSRTCDLGHYPDICIHRQKSLNLPRLAVADVVTYNFHTLYFQFWCKYNIQGVPKLDTPLDFISLDFRAITVPNNACWLVHTLLWHHLLFHIAERVYTRMSYGLLYKTIYHLLT